MVSAGMENRPMEEALLEKKNITWNMIGSLVYAAAGMILPALVNHLAGATQGGIFGFAYTTFGQQMFTMAYFGMRPIQSTDVGRRYRFGEYRASRLVTCFAAIVFSIGYLWICGYQPEKTAVVFLMVLYKVLDGFADVYESEFQRNGRLYLTGKAMAYRTLLSVTAFSATLFVTEKLSFSCAVAVVFQGIGVAVFDKAAARRVPEIDYHMTVSGIWGCIRESLLLFLSVFLDFIIFAMARYAVDARMSDMDTAVFNAIFLPASVINLAANFIIRPFLTRLSIQWEERQYSQFQSGVKKILAVIVLLTAAALAGAYLLGVPVLGLIYNVELETVKTGLLFIVLGGGFYAGMNLFYYILVILQCQRLIFFGYIPVFVLSFLLSVILVRFYGINGAAGSFLLEMAFLAVCFMVEARWAYARKRKVRG